MPGIFHVSDAASLALHALALLAKAGEATLSTKTIAETMGVSLAHLAKVMQRLEHAGYVRSRRGPAGGFILNRRPGDISLKAVYETIEGGIKTTHCLLGRPFCMGDCPLSRTLHKAEAQVLDELAKTSLADFAQALKLKSKKKAG